MNSFKRQLAFVFQSLAAVFCLAAAGCTSVANHQSACGPNYGPRNVYAAAPELPSEVRRVAVLPLTAQDASTDSASGCDALEPVLITELNKTGKFEVVPISADDLRSWTGRGSWSDSDELPRNFFEALQKGSGCDAVLFCRLTVFQAYPPMAVGWHLRLVEARTQGTIWAGDEVFVAENPGVKTGLTYFPWMERNSDREAWLKANSPKSFGQYSVAQLFETLPKR